MQAVVSLNDLSTKFEQIDHIALFIHNPDDESSRCAFRSITEATYLNQKTTVFVADVSQVKDIHPFYDISATPSILFFVRGNLVKTISGCPESEFLKALMNYSE
ncbi:MAG: hypothetical protein WAO52_05750 [Prolixibacteraceae bacterium]